jgi:hypothetical protein
MRAYPKIGTRVLICDGEYIGRQARTEKTYRSPGRIDVELLGGTHTLGVSVRLCDVERDTAKKIYKVDPQPVDAGDRLYSLRGHVFPLGSFITVKRVYGRFVEVESEYARIHVLAPRADFNRRWAHLDGHPIEHNPLWTEERTDLS